MKKMKHAFMALGIVILAASFFAACGGEDDPADTSPSLIYTLVLRTGTGNDAVPFVDDNVDMVQGTQQDISRALTDLEGATVPTAGIQFTFTLNSQTSGVTLNTAGSRITVAPAADVGSHSFTVNATKDGTLVASKNFTVTVALASYGVTLNPPALVIKHSETSVINTSFSAPNGATSGLTLTFACGTHGQNCGINFTGPTSNRYNISAIPNTVALGAHPFIVTVLQSGQPFSPSVTTNFPLTVQLNYVFDIPGSPFTVHRGEAFNLELDTNYTLTVSDGSTPNIGIVDNDGNVPAGTIKVGLHCFSDYANCDLFVAGREWAHLDRQISPNASYKAHTMLVQALDNAGYGAKLTEKQFVVTVVAAP